MLLKNNKNIASGANQSTVREYNQRSILSLIRRHSPIAKAEIAKMMGLSAQAVSVIIKGLEQEGLLLRDASIKGRVGQPSIPMRLNPEGVFTLGLKIGRRRAGLILMGFLGQPRCVKSITYAYPITEDILSFVSDNLPELISNLTTEQQLRIIGLGVAMPNELWNWAKDMNALQQDIDAWKEIDMASELTKLTGFDVSIQNDATAACAAELVFGKGAKLADFAYLYIGFFIGGGIVLNHSLFPGSYGNAGAFGSMPVKDAAGKKSQLIKHASIALLEQQLKTASLNTDFLWQELNDWSEYDLQVNEWIDYIAKYIATAIVASCSVIDFSHFIIDGAFPVKVRKRIVKTVREQLHQLDLQGIAIPKVEQASIESDPRMIGSASLPLFKHHLLDQNLLFNE